MTDDRYQKSEVRRTSSEFGVWRPRRFHVRNPSSRFAGGRAERSEVQGGCGAATFWNAPCDTAPAAQALLRVPPAAGGTVQKSESCELKVRSRVVEIALQVRHPAKSHGSDIDVSRQEFDRDRPDSTDRSPPIRCLVHVTGNGIAVDQQDPR